MIGFPPKGFFQAPESFDQNLSCTKRGNKDEFPKRGRVGNVTPQNLGNEETRYIYYNYLQIKFNITFNIFTHNFISDSIMQVLSSNIQKQHNDFTHTQFHNASGNSQKTTFKMRLSR